MAIPNTALQFISTLDQVLGTSDPATPNGAVNRELYKLLQNCLAINDQGTLPNTTGIKNGRGSTSAHASFTGVAGEITIDTDKDTVVVHDGATAGGFPLGRQRVVDVREFGAKLDGATDDTTAIQAAINICPEFCHVVIPTGTALVGKLTATGKDNITVRGPGKLKAKVADFDAVLYASGVTNFCVRDIDIDANGIARSGVATIPHGCLAAPLSTDVSFINVTCRNAYGITGGTLGAGPHSATAMSSSGSTRVKVIGCTFIDCGYNATLDPDPDEAFRLSATSVPSDGCFIRANYAIIADCVAYRCTDTAYVLEGSNFSRIGNSVAWSCGSCGAISNDTGDDCVCNSIDGLVGSVGYVGSTGGIIAVSCFGAGNLRQIKIANVSVRVEAGASGLGPGIQVRSTGTGRIIGLTLAVPSVDIGDAVGVLAQPIYISHADNVQIIEPYVRNDLALGSHGIHCIGDCTAVRLHGGHFIGNAIAIFAGNTVQMTVKNAYCDSPLTYGIYAGDTSSVRSYLNTVVTPGTAAEGNAGGATLVTFNYQETASWTPTYSSDLGDAAASFDGGAVNTARARHTTIGKLVFMEINFDGIIKAGVTPAYIDLTIPPTITPTYNNTYMPFTLLLGATWETGKVRIISPTTLRFYRAQSGVYTAGTGFTGLAILHFEKN